MKLAISNLIVVLAVVAAGCGTSSNTTTGPTLERCSVAVTNSMSSVGAAGGNGRLSVTAGRECTWSVTSSVPWITPRSPAGAQGDGGVDFVVAPNPNADSRRGSVTVGNQIIELVQEGASCRFDLQPNRADVEPNGGTGSFTVEGPDGCNWAPVSPDDWITVADSGNRTGASSVNFTVAANPGIARVGSIRVGTQAFTVAQSAPACRLVLSATNGAFGANTGTGTVTVTGVRGCTWTSSSSVPWISIGAGASGNGNGTVSFTVQSNPGAARNGIVTIAGQKFTVTQLQAECSYSIAPGDQSFPTAGGQGTVAVSTGAPCTWTTTDVPSWIAGIPATGTGGQTVNFNVEPNPGPARNVTLSIAGQSFGVSQAAGCAYSLAPASDNVTAGGGTKAFTVDTAAGCTWTSSGVPSWITGVPANGSGPQTINLAIAANAGPARSANIVVAGQTFTLSQSGGCSLSVAPDSFNASAAGGSSSFAVNAGAGCGWTSSGVPSWITGVPASGTGTQTINLTVAANTGGTRTASIVINGQTFTVTQAAVAVVCSYALNPDTYNAATAGASSSFQITTTAGCDWASSGVPSWITGIPATGSGTQTINFSVAANPDTAQRTANITLGGRTFTVTQAGAACNFSLNPTSYKTAAAAASSSFVVTTASGCGWTSTGVPSWITGVPATGTGTTTINFTVAANTGGARSASINIGGQTFDVAQAAAASCAYSLSPTSYAAAAAGGSSSFTLTTTSACAWTSSGVPSWITGVPSSGTGTRTVNFTVAANTGAARSVDISMGGQTFTVTQAAGSSCAYTVNPEQLTFDRSGSPPRNIALTTTAGCAWTATADQSWITIVSGGSGTGSGTIRVSLVTNSSGSARQGTISVGGGTITITQNP